MFASEISFCGSTTKNPQGSHKKRYFLNGRAPLELNGSWNLFFFLSFLVLKQPKTDCGNFFLPLDFWTKRAIFLSNIATNPLKDHDFASIDSLIYLICYLSKISFIFKQQQNKKGSKKVFFHNGPSFPAPPLLMARPLRKQLFFCGFPYL